MATTFHKIDFDEAEKVYTTIKVGDVLRVKYKHGWKDRSVTGPFHVRGIVDGRLIVRWFGEHKQWWHYDIKDQYSFAGSELSIDAGK